MICNARTMPDWRRFATLLLTIFPLCLAAPLAFGAVPEVLPPAPELQRYDPVLAQTLYLRLKPAAYVPGSIAPLLAMPEIRSARALLKPELSFTHNKKLQRDDRVLNKSGGMARILEAEDRLLRSYQVEYLPDELPEHFAARLTAMYPAIELAEPFHLPQFLGDGRPDDPRIDEQEFLVTIRALEAWEIYDGDREIVIGISDSGVFQQHKDLKDNLWRNPGEGEVPNGIDDDNNGYIDDITGCNFAAAVDGSAPGVTLGDPHGTAVAGLAGATANNNEGIVGTGNKCRIFPMKTLPNGSSNPLFLWESVIYSANMGFDVLNCSWGGFNYSETNRAIIEFAHSRDMAVVAGAGNHGDARPFYPAGYPGVLSVGFTFADDRVADQSPYGPHVGIMAPGQRALTTFNDNNYGRFDLSSASSPIAAGVVAIARGHHPGLDAEQVVEFVRQCNDNIEEQNEQLLGLIPGRINMLQVVTRDPMATPSIAPLSHGFLALNGLEQRHPVFGEETRLRIDLRNYLGAGGDLSFRLSVVGDRDNSVEVVNNLIGGLSIPALADFTLDDFSFRVVGERDAPVYFRVDISSADESYRDFFLLEFIPVPESIPGFSTFSNDLIRFSLGDRGTIGFAGIRRADQGVGFQYGRFGSLLFQSGLIVAADAGRVVSATKSSDPRESSDDFSVVQGFVEPERSRSVITDDDVPAGRRIGLRIEQDFIIPAGNRGVVPLVIDVENTSGGELRDIAIGYHFDWDVGLQGAKDLVSLFDEGPIPLTQDRHGIIGIVEHDDEFPVAVMAVWSDNPGAQPQFASFNNDHSASGTPFGTYDGFSNAEKHRALSSGTSLSYNEAGENALVIGMRFPGSWPAGEHRRVFLYFGAVATIDDVAAGVEQASATLLQTALTEFRPAPADWRAFPQPAAAELVLEGPAEEAGEVSVTLIDVMGTVALPSQTFRNSSSTARLNLDVAWLSAGLYFARVTTSSTAIVLPVIIR